MCPIMSDQLSVIRGVNCYIGVRDCKIQSGQVKRMVKGIFVTRDRPFFSPVKCEMANFFLVNRDFAKLFSVKRETNV